MTREKKHIVIRTDASSEIGTGHVIRDMCLADYWRTHHHAHITFMTQPLTGNLNAHIQASGFDVIDANDTDPVSVLNIIGKNNNAPIDWLVVDHYGLDATFELACRPRVKNILVIDDLANRPHHCDILVDQNFYCDPDPRYEGFISEKTQLLLGPAYALLRPEFETRRAALSSINTSKHNHINRMMVSLGGADPTNATQLVLAGLSQLNLSGIAVDVIVGAANPNPDKIKAQCNQFGFQFLHTVSDMAERMTQCDLFIGAGGTTTWERFALGLPGLVVSIADNHVEISEDLHTAGYHHYLGKSHELTPNDIHDAVSHLIQNPDALTSFIEKGMHLVDAQGTQRVVEAMIKQQAHDVSAYAR